MKKDRVRYRVFGAGIMCDLYLLHCPSIQHHEVAPPPLARRRPSWLPGKHDDRDSFLLQPEQVRLPGSSGREWDFLSDRREWKKPGTLTLTVVEAVGELVSGDTGLSGVLAYLGSRVTVDFDQFVDTSKSWLLCAGDETCPHSEYINRVTLKFT